MFFEFWPTQLTLQAKSRPAHPGRLSIEQLQMVQPKAPPANTHGLAFWWRDAQPGLLLLYCYCYYC